MGGKIAIVGTAPGSKFLAPFHDPSWTIWACSPGNINIPRWDAWFEMHTLDQEPFLTERRCTDYLEWLKAQTGKIYIRRPWPFLPKAHVLPIFAIERKFPPALLTSTVAWMLAFAILEEPPEDIGIWGVDMATDSEWGHQRIGCQALIWEARRRGIKVFVPPESELDVVSSTYGSRKSPMEIKLELRRREAQIQRDNAERLVDQNTALIHHIDGFMDGMEYVRKTWG
jgi:hypothetical protein